MFDGKNLICRTNQISILNQLFSNAHISPNPGYASVRKKKHWCSSKKQSMSTRTSLYENTSLVVLLLVSQ